jgi:hypothetical protein
MAGARDTGGKAQQGTSPITVSLNIVGGSPMFVGIVQQGTVAITSVVWNGSENLSQIGTRKQDDAAESIDLFGIKNPSAGNHNLVVTFNTNPAAGAAVYVIATTGGDTTTGWRSVFSRTQTDGAGPGLTVTDAQNGDLVIHFAEVFSTTITFDGGEDVTTQSTKDDNIQGSTFSAGLSTKAATGSTTVGCTDAADYAEMAVAMAFAGGGGGGDLSVSTIGEPVVGGSTF